MKSSAFSHDRSPADFLGVECAWPATASLGQSRLRPRRGRQLLRRLGLLAAAALLVTGLWHLGKVGYLHGKAWAAQEMIEHAWARTKAGQAQATPWPWADTWPVAHLSAPRQRTGAFVLAGANGRSIAFGPGHMFGTARPGAPGNSVIGAHRDTHFAFLEHLRPGDPIDIETPRGERVRYLVSEAHVVHKSQTGLLTQDTSLRELTLITCYPFDALTAGGPLRYMVRAREQAAQQGAPTGEAV